MTMIKNQKQAALTKERLSELRKAKDELEANKKNYSDAKYRVGINSLDSLIKKLEDELQTYNSLVEGNFNCLHPKAIEEIPNILIAARLAQRMSQKDLGALLNLKEQQIQRYEATDYETASWSRIEEIASALNLKFYFEKILIMDIRNDPFDLPEEISDAQITEAVSKMRSSGSIFIME